MSSELGNFLPPSEAARPATNNVIFDLDGVMLRWVSAHLPNAADQAEMYGEMQRAQAEGLNVYVLTNRPPGQMAALAYNLGVDYGYWVTESGGSVYDVRNHRAYVMPEWRGFAETHVPRLRQNLQQMLGVAVAPETPTQAQFEPGMGFVKTVILPPQGMPLEVFAQSVKEALIEGGYNEQFTIHVGKAVDIDPKGLSKAKGMEAVLALNNIDPQKIPTTFVADHGRDIPAATVLFQRGGRPAAVGNSVPEYREAVARMDGIVAPEHTSYHSSVAHILRRLR